MNSPTKKPLPLNVYQDRDEDRKRVAKMLDGVTRWAASTNCKVKQWKLHKGGFIQEEVSAKISAGNYIRKRSYAVAFCGREAVGVSLFPNVNSKGEKVHHAQCRDRLCPICNAIRASHIKPVIGSLIESEFNNNSRLFFVTLTVPHALNDKLKDTRKLLDGTWARFVRRKLIKEVFSERHRVAEVEYTENAGWHPHFHVLFKLDRASRAEYWARNRLQRLVRDEWVACCFSAARSMGRSIPAAYQVTLQEMRQCPDSLKTEKERADGKPLLLRWIPPRDEKRITAKAIKDGHRVIHHNKSWWVVQPIGKAVDELTKYITKRHSLDKNGKAKKGQVGFWDYTPEMVYEYMMGIRGWNLHCSSRGWALIQKAEKEALEAEKEIQEGIEGGADFYSWAQIVLDTKRAVTSARFGKLDNEYLKKYVRIHKALITEGCDVSAKKLGPWLARAAGEISNKRLPDLEATGWQMAAFEREQEINEKAERQRANREYIRTLAEKSNPPNLFTQPHSMGSQSKEGKHGSSQTENMAGVLPASSRRPQNI